MERPENEEYSREERDMLWITEYRKGKVEALGKLVEEYRRPLFGFILNMMERQGDAEEVFQEVWFRLRE